MYEQLGAALGGSGGGILGQIGGALSAPRRALWSAMGGPEHGNELVANLTGLDKEGLLARALGFGAEIAGDPLTYAGVALGGPLGKLWGNATGAASRLGGEIETLNAAKNAAYGGLQGRVAGEAAVLDSQLARVPQLAVQDVPGLAAGSTKTYAGAFDPAFAELEAAGLAGELPGNMPGVLVQGRGLPPGFGTSQVPGPKGQWHGSAIDRKAAASLPSPGLTPDELALMQKMGAAQPGGPLAMESIHGTAPGKMQFLDEFARANAGRINEATPMPTLGEHWGGNMPRGWAKLLGETPNLELPDAYDALNEMLKAAALKRQAMELGLGDALKVGGATYVGGLTGNYLQGDGRVR